MVSNEVRDRLGIYKSLGDVPSKHRLGTHTDQFEGDQLRTPYEQWVSATVDAEWKQDECRRVKDRWKAHMAEQGVHHALPKPAHVESFIHELMQEVSLDRVYRPYWLYLKRFFAWMMRRRDYPHLYNPVLVACAEYPSCGRIWE